MKLTGFSGYSASTGLEKTDSSRAKAVVGIIFNGIIVSLEYFDVQFWHVFVGESDAAKRPTCQEY